MTTEQAPEQLAEDVADLRATVAGLVAKVEAAERLAESLHENGAAAPAGAGPEQQPAAPPLIIKLAGDDYDRELAALSIWVEYVLVPYFLGEISTTAPWCERWWEHEPAVVRLHALWLAWQELTTPEVGGYTGPSVWARDHLRPTMDELRAPTGPFAACTTNPNRPQHTVPAPPTVLPVPQLEAAEEEDTATE